MNPREKVIEAERQVRGILEGHSNVIQCPFCGLESDEENGLLCCDAMAEVSDAVLNHAEFKQQIEVVGRVMEAMDKQAGAILN